MKLPRAEMCYLPEGKWIDYDNGKEYMGPMLLKDFEIPVEKTPLFVRRNWDRD